MALVPFTKPHLTIPDQIALLKQRGMTIQDDLAAAACLEKFGYYRLSGYWYPMRRSQLQATPNGQVTQVLNSFRPGVELRHAVDLCIFDKRLRLLLTDAIERIEGSCPRTWCSWAVAEPLAKRALSRRRSE